MKRKICSLIAGAWLVAGFAAPALAQGSPPWVLVPVDIWTCSFNDRNDMGDLDDWVAKVFDWDAGAMQVVGSATHQVIGDEVWVTVASADLPLLAAGYEWSLFTGVMIGDVPVSGPALVWYRWADEVAPPGPIFTDGFESGNLSAWSSSVQ